MFSLPQNPRVNRLLARLRTRQLELARAGRTRESADIALRVARVRHISSGLTN